MPKTWDPNNEDMTALFRVHRMRPSLKRLYIVEGVDPCIDECLGFGDHIYGRYAPFMIPYTPALNTLTKLKGGKTYMNEWGDLHPRYGHFRRVRHECWHDCQDRFAGLNKYQTSRGDWVKLTRGVRVDIAFSPEKKAIGHARRVDRNPITGYPAHANFFQGATFLGTLIESRTGMVRANSSEPTFYGGGTLKEPNGAIIYSPSQGLVEVLEVDSYADITALNLEEAGIQQRHSEAVLRGLNAKLLVDAAYISALRDMSPVIPKDMPKNLATACKLTGSDYRQTMIEYIEAEIDKDTTIVA